MSLRSRVSGTARRLAAALLLLTPVGAATAQAPARPFAPGERLTYEVRYGSLRVGTGSLEVRGIETIRGRSAYHTVFRVQGGTAFFRVDDTFQSWFSTDDLSSLRYHQDQDEGPKERTRRYEIFPERRTYTELTGGEGEQPSVARPLDDGSFLYFIRTIPLEVGRTYRFDNYFKPDRRRREEMTPTSTTTL